jgi:hypothetical protein
MNDFAKKNGKIKKTSKVERELGICRLKMGSPITLRKPVFTQYEGKKKHKIVAGENKGFKGQGPTKTNVINDMDPVIKKLRARSNGFTVEFNHEQYSKEEAWELVPMLMNEAKDALLKDNRVFAVIWGIEMHFGKSQKSTNKNKVVDFVKPVVNSSPAPQSIKSNDVSTKLGPFDVEWEDHKYGDYDICNNETRTLYGYPHVHGVVVHIDIGQGHMKGPDLSNVFGERFPDVHIGVGSVKSKDKGYDTFSNAFFYCFKNTKLYHVLERLPNLWPNTVYLNYEVPDMTKAMTKYLEKLPFQLYISDRKLSSDNVLDQKNITPDTVIVTKAGSGLSRIRNKIINLMIKNDLKLFKGEVFRKVKGSKMTYVKSPNLSTPGELLGHSLRGSNADAITRHRASLEKEMSSDGQSLYPYVVIDYQWIEYANGFLCIGTQLFLTEQTEHCCFKYYGKASYDSRPLYDPRHPHHPKLWTERFNAILGTTYNDTPEDGYIRSFPPAYKKRRGSKEFKYFKYGNTKQALHNQLAIESKKVVDARNYEAKRQWYLKNGKVNDHYCDHHPDCDRRLQFSKCECEFVFKPGIPSIHPYDDLYDSSDRDTLLVKSYGPSLDLKDLPIISDIKHPMVKDLTSRMYKLLLPKWDKDSTLSIVGPPNSGKSSMVETLVNILPTERRVTIADGNFALQNTIGRSVIILDEHHGMEAIGYSNALQMLSGIPVEVPMKHKMSKSSRAPPNMIIMGNHSLGGVFPAHNKAMSKRVKEYKIPAMDDNTVDEYAKRKMNKERPYVILMLAQLYHKGITVHANYNDEVLEIVEEFYEEHSEWFYKRPELDFEAFDDLEDTKVATGETICKAREHRDRLYHPDGDTVIKPDTTPLGMENPEVNVHVELERPPEIKRQKFKLKRPKFKLKSKYTQM